MARKRMSWAWVEDYPVFVYTTWVAPRVFNVDILIGVKGDQNAGTCTPRDKPDHSYTTRNFYSKNAVVEDALVVAEWVIKKKLEKDNG